MLLLKDVIHTHTMEIIIKDNRLLPTKGYVAITIWPFIFVDTNAFNWKNNKDKVLNHERIHLQQQKELLLVGFYLIYLLDFIIKRIRYKNHSEAYKGIIFEKESYDHEDDLTYLNHRERYNCFKS